MSMFSDDQLRDIGLGIGRGFQSYDPDNPFKGAGAALEATIMAGVERRRRSENIDLALEEEERKERRATEREERGSERDFKKLEASLRLKADLDEQAEDRKRQAEREEDQRTRDMLRGTAFFPLDGQRNARRESQGALNEAFAMAFPSVQRFPGKPPINPSELEMETALLQQGKRRGRDYSMKSDAPSDKGDSRYKYPGFRDGTYFAGSEGSEQ
jgi:hypothetical protein